MEVMGVGERMWRGGFYGKNGEVSKFGGGWVRYCGF